MTSLSYLLFFATTASVVVADPSAVEVLGDIYKTCLRDFSVACVKPKALGWINLVSKKPQIRLTEDLTIVNNGYQDAEMQRGLDRDVLDSFEDFLQSHNLVANVPGLLRPDGPFGKLVPRTFQPEPIQVPLAATGRSKVIKKVIFPFLLGLKFKTAILVPLALALIALKTWKAMTLGLISLVLTGAIAIFSKFNKQPAVEVIHYPQHLDHHIDPHHIDVIPSIVPSVPVGAPVPVAWPHPVYRSKRAANELAFGGYKR
ncbi:uncharacterized protein LOC132703852 [Cylas formicarius]|uniref:uncharacterized protein LOC132703852 n=1 Tax=Cylas formicarius TaxID=197179 RepID=UPI002958A5F7|nr:uncharacterized protein LOC132703852 [Cylas formicarius]